MPVMKRDRKAFYRLVLYRHQPGSKAKSQSRTIVPPMGGATVSLPDLAWYLAEALDRRIGLAEKVSK